MFRFDGEYLPGIMMVLKMAGVAGKNVKFEAIHTYRVKTIFWRLKM